jgi:hypothetical protein
VNSAIQAELCGSSALLRTQGRNVATGPSGGLYSTRDQGAMGVRGDDEGGVMRFFLRQKRRAEAVRRAMEELTTAAAWSPPPRVVLAPIKRDRHELGSAARIDGREARGWARLDRS